MTASILLFGISGGEIFVVLLVVLLFFGSKKIPELARGLGKGMREFKNAANEIQRDIQSTSNDIKKTVDTATKPTDDKKD